MTDTTLTLALVGKVPLDLFARTLERFLHLVEVLTDEVSADVGISWIVDESAASGPVVTIRGHAEHPEVVERVARAFAAVGQSLESHQPIPFSPRTARAAESLTHVLDGHITALRLVTGDEVATITSADLDDPAIKLLGAFGSVEGRIDELNLRNAQRFILVDSLFGQAVKCQLSDDQAGVFAQAKGSRAIVQGWVKRDRATGRPIAIDPVESIEILAEVTPGSYRRAKGVAPANPGEPSPDVTIRRLRDG